MHKSETVRFIFEKVVDNAVMGLYNVTRNRENGRKKWKKIYKKSESSENESFRGSESQNKEE